MNYELNFRTNTKYTLNDVRMVYLAYFLDCKSDYDAFMSHEQVLTHERMVELKEMLQLVVDQYESGNFDYKGRLISEDTIRTIKEAFLVPEYVEIRVFDQKDYEQCLFLVEYARRVIREFDFKHDRLSYCIEYR